MPSGGEDGGRAGPGVRVLVVDDEEPVARTVAGRLQRGGYEVEVALSQHDAMERVEGFACDLVFSDIHMPDGSGLDLARRLKERDPTIQVVLMTGNTTIEQVIQALRLHADDYLLKPFDTEALLHAADRAVRHRRLVLENRSYRLELEERVREQAHRLERLYLSGVHTLVRALEAKDPHTRGHSDRVAEFAAALASEVPGVDADLVRRGAQLHDIGKIGIKSAVLRKPGPLTAEEVDHVRSHPAIGEQILAPMLEERAILDIVRHHHERWDGLGYPDRLRGPAIPLVARIVAIADAYDAMTTTRPYRPALSAAQAVAEIRDEAGRQFDPDLARTAIRAFVGDVDLAS